jgi:hypothetical protein
VQRASCIWCVSKRGDDELRTAYVVVLSRARGFSLDTKRAGDCAFQMQRLGVSQPWVSVASVAHDLVHSTGVRGDGGSEAVQKATPFWRKVVNLPRNELATFVFRRHSGQLQRLWRGLLTPTTSWLSSGRRDISVVC